MATNNQEETNLLTYDAITIMCRHYENDRTLTEPLTVQIIKADKLKRRDTNRYHVSMSCSDLGTTVLYVLSQALNLYQLMKENVVVTNVNNLWYKF